MDSGLFEMLGRELAPEQVTNRLREAITAGVLRPGERLNQAELAERLGVSRMPVREALHRLHSEGLVTLQPYRGAVVAGVSRRELQEIYEMRVVLETLALRIGYREGRPVDVARAEAILHRLDAVTASEEWLELNTAFHGLLYEGAERPLLLESIDMLRTKSDRYLRLFAARRDRMAHAQEEHWAILHALRNEDVDTSAHLLQEHLQSTIKSLSEPLGELEPDQVPEPSNAIDHSTPSPTRGSPVATEE